MTALEPHKPGNHDVGGSRDLVNCLKAFNRKERYWLLWNTLCKQGGQVPLSNAFLAKLNSELSLDVPADAWWAIDYHIDWLIGALLKHAGRSGSDGPNNVIKYVDGETAKEIPDKYRVIQGNQEDVDFILAFERSIVLIEAKGTGSWSNRQVRSKCRRLHGLFQMCVPENIDIYLVFMSPGEGLPSKLQGRKWPTALRIAGTEGMRRPHFIPMTIEYPGGGFEKIGWLTGADPARWTFGKTRNLAESE